MREAISLGLLAAGEEIGTAARLLETIELFERSEDGHFDPAALEPHHDWAGRLGDVTGRLRGEWHHGPFDVELVSSAMVAIAIQYAARPLHRHSEHQLWNAAQCAAHAVGVQNGSSKHRWDVDPAEVAAQCDLIRDVVQHPDLAATIAPKWKTETVVSLARGIYDQRAFDRMPILADALEETGCDDPTVLRHCRADAPHVRGCWVVDQVLGYE